MLFLLIVLATLMAPAWSQVRFSEDFTIKAPAFTSAVNDGVNIWLNHPDSQTLSAVDPQTGNRVFQVYLSGKGENLAFDGRHLLLTQDASKKVMAIDRASGRLQLYLDLKTISGDRNLYLEPLRSGEIMGITAGNDRIWIACGAGYSSSIYEIDSQRQIVVSHRFAPGPSPIALKYHQGNLWVLDRDSQALRCLKDCRQLVYDLAIEVGANPVTLIDVADKFLVANAVKGNTCVRGVAKKDLQALVPEKVDTKVYQSFKKRERRQGDRQRKVAVLISGDTAASGYNEFWSDVVIMYRILQNRGYGEIYVLYADGRDYACPWDKYQQQMTDFAATKEYVQKIFAALAYGDTALGIDAMGDNDILFVYTFDHGASNGDLCLWNSGRYSPEEMLGAVTEIKSAKKIFYMQQCFSGAFKDKFAGQLEQMAIVTAASSKQYAYRADTEKEYNGGKTYYHGEFNWHFMTALAGQTPSGEVVAANEYDADNNGQAEIDETFAYYEKMNSNSKQTPQYVSNPGELGQNTTP